MGDDLVLKYGHDDGGILFESGVLEGLVGNLGVNSAMWGSFFSSPDKHC